MADLSDPDKYELADVVTKNSKTGITSNKRLLVIKKGHLYYYSSPPKNFKTNSKVQETYHELPKCSIEILNIKKINGFEDNSNYFSIEFEARHMMEREDIRKTMTLEEFNFAPKNTKEMITWQFTCDNQFVKQKWVHALETLHAHYSKEKINIQKFFENINKKEDEKVQATPMRSSLMVPWRDEQMKKSNSNESLRKSNMGHSAKSNNSPSWTKKSVSSEEKNSDERNKFLHPMSSEELVESFMKIEKTKSFQEEKPPVIEQQMEESMAYVQKETPKNAEFNEQPQPLEQKIKQEAPSSQKAIEQRQIIEDSPPNVEKVEKQSALQKQPSNKILIPAKQHNSSKSMQRLHQIQQTQEIEKPRPLSKQPKFLQIRKTESFDNELEPPASKLPPKPPTQAPKLPFRLDSSTTFYQLLYFACNRDYPFDKRLEAQQRYNALLGSFGQKASQTFIEYVQSKGNERSAGRYSERKISDCLVSLEVGYLLLKVGYVSTQPIVINGSQKIYYDETMVKSMKKQIKIYDRLHATISHKIKSLNSDTSSQPVDHLQPDLHPTSARMLSQLRVSVHQIRVPLCSYVEYKGICCLAYDQTRKSQQQDIIDNDLLGELRLLFRAIGYNSACFTFKKLGTGVGTLYLVYYTNNKMQVQLGEKTPKHHDVTFETPMNVSFLKKAHLEGASTSTQSLARYIRSINGIQDTRVFACPRQEIVTSLAYCYMCKYIRRFFRAGQAEIDPVHFTNLLLRGDANIAGLFDASDFDGGFRGMDLGQDILGVFFEFLNYYLGFVCEVDVTNLSKYGRLLPIGVGKQKSIQSPIQPTIIKSIRLQPRIINYSLGHFQLYESFSKVGKYISSNNKQLSHRVLELKETSLFDNPHQPGSHPYPIYSEVLLNQSELNYLENDYITSISKSKQFLSLVSPPFNEDEQKWHTLVSSHCLPAYLLMLKCYSKFSMAKFTQLLGELLQATMHSFGQDSSMMVTVLEFVAMTYLANADYQQAEKFMRMGVALAERVYAGYSRVRLAELYIGLHRVLRLAGGSEPQQLMARAEAIVEEEGTAQDKLRFLIYCLQLLAGGKVSTQGEQKTIQLIHAAQNIIDSREVVAATRGAYYKLVYSLGGKYNKTAWCEQAVHKLWQGDSDSKIVALELAHQYVTARNSSLASSHHEILARSSLSREKCLLVLEQAITQYRSLLDMVADVMRESEDGLIEAVLRLLPPGAVRRGAQNEEVFMG